MRRRVMPGPTVQVLGLNAGVERPFSERQAAARARESRATIRRNSA